MLRRDPISNLNQVKLSITPKIKLPLKSDSMVYLVEGVNQALTQQGKPYLKINVNSGTEKFLLYVWNIPADIDEKVFFHKIAVCTPEKKNEWKSVLYKDIKFYDYDELPEGHPIRSIKLVGDINDEKLHEFILSLVEKYVTSETWIQMFKSIQFADLIKGYEKFCAGRQIHHAYKCGLTEHTYEVLSIWESLYQNPLFYKKINPQVCIFASSLHDWGKTLEYNLDDAFSHRKESDLFGHPFMGAAKAKEFLESYFRNEISLVNDEVSNIIHCILSHHGQLDWGSPVLPSTMEAYVVHSADLLSGRASTRFNATEGERDKWLSLTVWRNTSTNFIK